MKSSVPGVPIQHGFFGPYLQNVFVVDHLVTFVENRVVEVGFVHLDHHTIQKSLDIALVHMFKKLRRTYQSCLSHFHIVEKLNAMKMNSIYAIQSVFSLHLKAHQFEKDVLVFTVTDLLLDLFEKTFWCPTKEAKVVYAIKYVHSQPKEQYYSDLSGAAVRDINEASQLCAKISICYRCPYQTKNSQVVGVVQTFNFFSCTCPVRYRFKL